MGINRSTFNSDVPANTEVRVSRTSEIETQTEPLVSVQPEQPPVLPEEHLP